MTSEKSEDLPSLDLSGYFSSGRHGRQSPPVHYQLSTLCGLRRLLFLPPQICSERKYVTSKPETETENRFWPFPKPKKTVLQKEPGFWKPYPDPSGGAYSAPQTP